MKKQLRKSDIRVLNDEIKTHFRFDEHISPRSRVELIDNEIYLVDNRPLWFRREGRLFPTIQILLDFNFLRKVTVDMGAVKFVSGGADIMRPGIVHMEKDIAKDEIIAVVDERHQKPLAVGITLFDEKTINEMDKGKVISTIHYVGDRIWNMHWSL